MQRVLACSLFGLLFASCQLGKMQIEYVFPEGFRGPAVIRENQQNGIQPCNLPSLPTTYQCVLEFPVSGVLNIQGESPGKVWHNASARYADGTLIPVPYNTPGSNVSKETIALWTFGSVQQGEDWLFVGNEDEFRRFKNEKETYKYPH